MRFTANGTFVPNLDVYKLQAYSDHLIKMDARNLNVF